MMMGGVKKQHSSTTIAMLGSFRKNKASRDGVVT
jgi:GTP cyclohydrolase I